MSNVTKGILKTVIWTQIHEAITEDTGIALPTKAGPCTTAAIGAIIEALGGKITIVQGPIPTVTEQTFNFSDSNLSPSVGYNSEDLNDEHTFKKSS